jgi:hypothetical protein
MPARIAFAALGSMRGPADAEDEKAGEQQELQQKQGPQRGEPDRLQATHQQSRQAEHRHEDRNRQHVRDLRFATGDDVRGQDDQIAGDVGGEQAAEPEEADDVDTSSDHAEHGRKQLRAE